MNVNPTEDRIVVSVLSAEGKTPGGIVLPDSAKEKPQRGKVVSVGPGRLLDNGERHPIGLSVGDEVLFTRYGGVDIEIGGEEVKILRECDVLAVLS